MNDLVKELAQQAAEQVVGIEPEAIMITETDTAYIEVPSTFILAFAELIVRECCEMMQGFTFEEIATKVIKKNFGVEE